MIHRRQDLPLVHEPRHHFFGIHAELDNLQRHQPAHRLQLLGLVDSAHAAFTKQPDQPVRSDHVRRFVQRYGAERAQCRPFGSSMCSQQPLDAGLEAGIAVAGSLEIGTPPHRRQFQTAIEEFLLALVVQVSHYFSNAHMVIQPSPRVGPIALHRGQRASGQLRGLLQAEASEVSQFQNPGEALVHLRERVH